MTTRLPEQQPQEVQSVISGKLEKWYVKEGNFVKAGDTLVFISEIKNEYFDPKLIERTTDQVNAKTQSIQSYDDKINALNNQYKALDAGMKLNIEQTKNKIQQARNKISIDSIDLIAYNTNLKIAENQLSNYNVRQQFYQIVAPQSGYVTKHSKKVSEKLSKKEQAF